VNSKSVIAISVYKSLDKVYNKCIMSNTRKRVVSLPGTRGIFMFLREFFKLEKSVISTHVYK
jgi:hypothetical protein